MRDGQASAREDLLGRNPANHVPLTPVSFLVHAARAFPDRPAIVHGQRSLTWGEVYDRCRRFAAVLAGSGVAPGDVVAIMLPNVPAMIELHFAVPLAGAVLNPLNIRLDPAALAFMLDHGGARVLLVDPEYAAVITAALAGMRGPQPLVIDVPDPEFGLPGGIGNLRYEDALAAADPEYRAPPLGDEWAAVSLNYTSGTTGDPKGVLVHHRGAYLSAISNALVARLGQQPRLLWTLPLFHCNGWGFAWASALVGGVNVCLRKVEPAAVAAMIVEHRITHMCGAPIVYAALFDSLDTRLLPPDRAVIGLIAGAAPSLAVLEQAEQFGFALTHLYGLTEVYGPAAVCAEQDDWAGLAPPARAVRVRRQGIAYPLQEDMAVLDPATMRPVPRDGVTVGEIMFRGNMMMKGYLGNPSATAAAFAGGWFHTGDLAVMDADGYALIKDRAKDVIISGGENISSLELEEVLHQHPAVLCAAVVARPDPTWGESPCAFVELRAGCDVGDGELDAHCRTRLAGFKRPRSFVIAELPKTATGKIRKDVLRQRAMAEQTP